MIQTIASAASVMGICFVLAFLTKNLILPLFSKG